MFRSRRHCFHASQWPVSSTIADDCIITNSSFIDVILLAVAPNTTLPPSAFMTIAEACSFVSFFSRNTPQYSSYLTAACIWSSLDPRKPVIDMMSSSRRRRDEPDHPFHEVASYDNHRVLWIIYSNLETSPELGICCRCWNITECGVKQHSFTHFRQIFIPILLYLNCIEIGRNSVINTAFKFYFEI